MIVAQEGGPGLPTLGTRSSYLALYKPLRADRDLVMVDARGTGQSGAIDCEPLQSETYPTEGAEAACGASLGGASVLYGTGLAVEDMIAVLDALGVGKVDYYGDSYGTFFGQVLAARHPERLRSLVLDGAYPVIGESPWYPNAGAAMRRGFDLACKRAPYCAALPGASLGRIEALLERLRRHPISGEGPDGDGKLRKVTADPAALGLMLYRGRLGLDQLPRPRRCGPRPDGRTGRARLRRRCGPPPAPGGRERRRRRRWKPGRVEPRTLRGGQLHGLSADLRHDLVLRCAPAPEGRGHGRREGSRSGRLRAPHPG